MTKEERLTKLKELKYESALIEHKRYEIYREWHREIMDKFAIQGRPLYVKINRGKERKNKYMMISCVGGGVIGTPVLEAPRLLSPVTTRFLFEGICLDKMDDGWYYVYNTIQFSIDDEYEIITKEEFENYLNDFFDTCLTPTKENMKRAYRELDLEHLFKNYPEYFNREDVKFFIDRFDVLDNIIDDSDEDFDDWL